MATNPAVTNTVTIALEMEKYRRSGNMRVSPDAMEALVRYRWPGNVRELHNELRRAALLSDGVILESHRGFVPYIVQAPIPCGV